MSDKKLVIELEKIVEDEVYRKLMDMHWERIERFKEEMFAKIDSESKYVAKAVALELMETIKKEQKRKP